MESEPITLTLGAVLSTVFAAGFSKLQNEVPVTTKQAMGLIALRKRLAETVKNFEEARDATLRRHGVEGDGGTWTVAQENVEKFQTEMSEALAVTVEVPRECGGIKVPEDRAVFTAAELEALGSLVSNG